MNRPVNENVSLRLNALYEDSESYRDGVTVERKGINPTIAWRSGRTLVTAGYEYFKDDRVADRGIPSYRGRPVDTGRSTFFGNADESPTGSRLNAGTVYVEHQFDNGLVLKNRTRYSDQEKFYQNVFPGAVSADGTQVSIAAYNNATDRKSLFNQTDVTKQVTLGGMKHTLLGGVELGRQETDNFRETGYFPGDVTNVLVPLSDPTTNLPVTFRQSATDADNTGTAKVMALYVQDQIAFSPQWQMIVGLRYDKFEMDFTNKRTGENIDTSDDLVSPRIGVIYKPLDNLSLYANYSIAYQPRAGEQLSSLNVDNAALDPEKFKSYEIGAKWDVTPRLSATAAIFRLDRTNVLVPDPNDPTQSILTDGQRNEGFELGLTGQVTPAWSVTGGYAYTKAKVTADTSATIRDGARIGQVPRHTFSLWNRYDFTRELGAGLGVIHRTSMLAATEQIGTDGAPPPNVTLPSYTRVDAAVYYRINQQLGVQANVENLFDKKYYLNAHSNNNITPGSPRALRVSLNAQF